MKLVTLMDALPASPTATVRCIDLNNGDSFIASGVEFDDGTALEAKAGAKVCLEWLGGEWKIVAAECP